MNPQHIHIAGVGGIVTSALAAELIRRGHRVTGSDEYILPPANEVLAGCGLNVHDGYDASQVAGSVDLAVVGAMLKPGNPVVDEILRRRIRHVTWPRLLSDLGLLAPHNGVVAGTNGKTTTSCMWSWIMEQTGIQADRVIGGSIANWPGGVSLRGAEYCILEGDEYPCGLGDRNPKFAHYQPEVAILLNVHFDHPDVFSDEREVFACYSLLADLLPPDGLLIFNDDDPRCRKLASAARCKSAGFGMKKHAEAQVRSVRHERDGTAFLLNGVNFFLPLWGNMNAQNAAAAALAAQFWGVPLEDSARALRQFPGVQRRQKRIRVDDEFVLLTDSAYHPDAVHCLLDSLRAHFPRRPVGLVLQPRHTTGTGNWQQRRWPRMLRQVSKLITMDSVNPSVEDPNLFSSAKLCQDIQKRGIVAHHANDAHEAAQHFQRLASVGDVWVLCLENWFTQPLDDIVKWSMQLKPTPPCVSSSPSAN